VASGSGPAEPRAAPEDPSDRLADAQGYIDALLPGAALADGPPAVFQLPETTAIPDLRERFLALQRRLAPLGLLPLLRTRAGRPVLLLVPRPAAGRWAWQTNVVLFLATVATTFYSGFLLTQGIIAAGYQGSAVVGGIAFSASVLFILGAHEAGHKLVAIRRGIDASLPYFIPMIPPAGTMGAVIITRTPAPNRDSLMDLGASGPIAGFLAAIPVLLYGISQSLLVRPGRLDEFVSIPDPLLIRWLIDLVLAPPGDTVVLGHPVLFAGWIGLIVTSINLLPAGMLDGGHAVRAVFGSRIHSILSYVGAAMAVYMRFYPMAILIVLFLQRGHVGPLDDLSPPTPSRLVTGLALVLIFALSAVRLPPLF
jgi:membrane-associated protease RseP (regulator of RpoE activity)